MVSRSVGEILCAARAKRTLLTSRVMSVLLMRYLSKSVAFTQVCLSMGSFRKIIE